MKKLLDTLARYTLFPEDSPCLGCGCEMPLDRHHLCQSCAGLLEPAVKVCPVCGRSGDGTVCKDCEKGRRFVKAVAAYNYTGSCKGIIYAMKYRDTLYAADFMAWDMVACCDFASKVDIVTSVPSRREALLRRGYNQSRELAVRCAKLMDRPYIELLEQKRGAKPQHELSAAQRRANYADSIYGIYPLEGQTVLLIDDVFTTGATADACAQVLTDNGASEVYVAVFASVPAFDKKS